MDSEYCNIACDLLIKLYRMMCYACNSYYDRVHRKEYWNIIGCAATGILSMNGLNSNQESVLIILFDSQDNICLVLKIAKERLLN